MKPVKFLSESEFAKSITTESKVFSIHAIGIVKGYKRETRLAVDAVVDFRNAPQPTAAPVAGAPAPPPPVAGAATAAIAGAVAPATGGTLVYYRID
jgi:general secretion pathway protein K